MPPDLILSDQISEGKTRQGAENKQTFDLTRKIENERKSKSCQKAT